MILTKILSVESFCLRLLDITRSLEQKHRICLCLTVGFVLDIALVKCVALAVSERFLDEQVLILLGSAKKVAVKMVVYDYVIVE